MWKLLQNLNFFLQIQPGKPITKTPKKSSDLGSSMKSNASSLFSGLTTDWFS